MLVVGAGRSRFMRTTVLLCSLFAALGVIAHPGGVDADGGHIDRKTGVYHFHRGTNAPSGSTTVPSSSSQIDPAPPAAPLQSQTPTPVSSDGDVNEAQLKMESGTAEFQKEEAEAGSAFALNNLPWWVYLAGLGCGYVVWEMASYYHQKQTGKR
jgi:hypothetical protein